MYPTLYVEKRSSSSLSSDDVNEGNDGAPTKKPRVLGPAMPPQPTRDIQEKVIIKSLPIPYSRNLLRERMSAFFQCLNPPQM